MAYNRVILMGRLTGRPELKSTGEGTEYCKFTVAVDRSYTKKGEEKQADFINCTAWRGTAVFIEKYFDKGQMILVQGEWRHESYMKDDEKRYSDYCTVDAVSFCGSKSDTQSESPAVETEEELPF